MNFILIDGSYFIFYRYYALHAWWKLAKPDTDLNVPIDNSEFVEKYRKTFVDKIGEIEKKLKIKSSIKMVAKDCSRKDIWRNKHFEKYKGHRVDDDDFQGGPFFAMAYNDNLFGHPVLEYPELEADDCIAITTNHILNTYPTATVWIIANDMDYLQLAGERVKIYNLKYKDITTSKNCTGDANRDLFCKIIIGDKSDNIPGVFKKCGIKTALKMYHDKEIFLEKLHKTPNAIEIYERNKKIIDFNEIPKELVLGFRKTCLKL